MTSKSILLMEGGPFGLIDETSTTRQLKIKIRLFSVLFPQVLISSSDFVESNKLWRVASQDRPIWEKGGSVAIYLANDVNNLKEYVERRLVPGRRAVDKGRVGRSLKTIIREARERLGVVENITPLVKFDVNEMRKMFKSNTLDAFREFGYADIANRLATHDDFYRGLVMEAVEHLPDSQAIGILERVNAYYYLSAATHHHATCAIQPRYATLYQEVFDKAFDPASSAFVTSISKERLEYFRYIKSLLQSTLEKLQIDINRLIDMDPEKFAELCSSKETKAFRRKFSNLVDKAEKETLGEKDAISTIEEFYEVFSNIVTVDIKNELNYRKYYKYSNKVLGILPVFSALIFALNFLVQGKDIPGIDLVKTVSAVEAIDTLVINPSIKRIYRTVSPMTLFYERYKEVSSEI